GIRAEGVAVERAIRVVGIVRNHGEPVLRAAAQVYVQAVNFVTIFDEAEAVAAGRSLGHRAGARSYQGAAVAFRDASADFPVTGGGVQAAQVVGEQTSGGSARIQCEVLVGGRAVGAAGDNGVGLVRQAIGIRVVRIKIATIKQAIRTALRQGKCAEEQDEQGQPSNFLHLVSS